MRAVLMKHIGGPEALSFEEVPTPTVKGPHDLRVRLKAAGVNPLDLKLRSRGTYFPDKLPAILGCDGAGVVDSVGSGVTRFKVGDEVYFCNGGIGDHPGNYAEYSIVDERFVAHKPKTMDFVQAAAAPLVCITAWEALVDRTKLREKQTVLIHAGAGGVGHVAVQLAKLRGAHVITTVSTTAKVQFARNLGADEVINYKRDPFPQRVLELTEHAGVDIAFDTVGGQTFSKTISTVKYYGDLVTILEPPADCDWKTARLRNLRISLELMLTPMYRHLAPAQEHQAHILSRCAEYIDSDKLTIHVDRAFPLEEAAQAHHHLAAGDYLGKIVLTIP